MSNLNEIKSMIEALGLQNNRYLLSETEALSATQDDSTRGQESLGDVRPAWFPEIGIQPRSPESSPLMIPVKHKTSSSYLLSLPSVKALIGEYPPDLFYRLESKSQLPQELNFDYGPTFPPPFVIPTDVAVDLVAVFFATVHPNHPILDYEGFQEAFSKFLKTGPDSSIESALSMVVLALGVVASSPPDASTFSASPPGMRYIQYAMHTLLFLSSWSFSFDLMLPQGLVLASVYFAYIVRPLQSWRLIYSATALLQFKLSGYAIHASIKYLSNIPKGLTTMTRALNGEKE